LTNWCYELEL